MASQELLAQMANRVLLDLARAALSLLNCLKGTLHI